MTMTATAPLHPEMLKKYKDEDPMSKETFISELINLGKRKYHSLHPFHKLLHSGKLSFEQVQAWALNRYYYQCSIPIKDLTLMTRINDVDLRLKWRSRVIDHEGDMEGSGGIERYLKLCKKLKLNIDYVKSCDGILPATRYAVDAYVIFVRERSLLEAIASSLTEMYAPAIHRERIAGFIKHYEWADELALSYFKQRLNEAPKDAEFGRAWVIENARTRSEQEAVLNAVNFKTDCLWAQLDALYYSYVNPGYIPPEAFVPEEFSIDNSIN